MRTPLRSACAGTPPEPPSGPWDRTSAGSRLRPAAPLQEPAGATLVRESTPILPAAGPPQTRTTGAELVGAARAALGQLAPPRPSRRRGGMACGRWARPRCLPQCRRTWSSCSSARRTGKPSRRRCRARRSLRGGCARRLQALTSGFGEGSWWGSRRQSCLSAERLPLPSVELGRPRRWQPRLRCSLRERWGGRLTPSSQQADLHEGQRFPRFRTRPR